jgi:hypothetical protein
MNVRRTALLLILVIGVVLMIFPFVTNLFGKTAGTEALTDTFRPTFTHATLEQTRTDFDGIKATAHQLQTETLPALPDALGMTDHEFATFLADNYPKVDHGVQELPRILPRLEKLVSGLEAEQGDFDRADAIPAGFLPITTVPWIVLVPGLALAVLAGLGLRREDEGAVRAALAGSLVVGLVLAVAAIGLDLHGKGAAVDRLTDALGPFFSEDGAAQTREDMDTVQAMADQLQARTIPDLAKALGMTPKEFDGFLTDNFPTVASGVASFDTVLPRFQADVTAISDNVGNFQKTADIPFSFLPTSSVFWWLLLPGLVLIAIPVAVSRLEAGGRTPTTIKIPSHRAEDVVGT